MIHPQAQYRAGTVATGMGIYLYPKDLEVGKERRIEPAQAGYRNRELKSRPRELPPHAIGRGP